MRQPCLLVLSKQNNAIILRDSAVESNFARGAGGFHARKADKYVISVFLTICPRFKGLTIMRKQKVYLETTLFNFYFDEDREAHVDTVRLFEDIAEGKYEAFTSDYAINELENTQSEKR